MAEKGNVKEELNDLLQHYELLSMELSNDAVCSFTRQLKTILAKSGKTEDIIKQVQKEYIKGLKDHKLGNENDEPVINFKREMNSFFKIEEPKPRSPMVHRSANHSTRIDVKSQSVHSGSMLGTQSVNNASMMGGSMSRAVDAGSAADVKARSVNSNSMMGASMRNAVNAGSAAADTQEINKIREENQLLRNENDNLKKECNSLNRRAQEHLGMIQKLEMNVNENYENECKLKEQLHNYKHDIEQLKKAYEDLAKQANGLARDKAEMDKYIKRKKAEYEDTLKNEQRKHEEELKTIIAEKDDLRDRFSKLAGSKLTDQNPDITDLSDPNRAMKLSERFGALYDDDWTNAFEALTDLKMEQKTAIQTLLQMLNDAWMFCEHTSESQLQTLNQIYLHPVQDVPQSIDSRQAASGSKFGSRVDSKKEKMIRTLRRDVGVMQSTVNEIKQAFHLKTKSWIKENKYDPKVVEACSPYLQACAEICWLMVLPDPPLFMITDLKSGDRVDPNLYSVYSTSGDKINYLVWPALFNCKGGGLLSKGVVEPIRTVKKGK